MSKQHDREHMEDAAEDVDEGIKIAVPEFVADKDNPFAGDLLDREPRVRMLCDFVGAVSDHAVIAVDGQWGSGKTAFLKMCRAYLEQQDVRVVAFNAWTESYTTDPLFNLASALADVVEEERRGQLIEAAKAVGLAALRELPFEVGAMAAAGAEVLGEDAGFPNGLDQYRDCVRGFREELEAAADRESGPLVVLVDELDRCLPEQVVEYLRAVHNLLAVLGVVVVMAINSEQAANGLAAVYGTDFDAEKYLQRFFDLGVSLDGALGVNGLLALIRQLRGHLVDEIEAEGSADYIDTLLSIPALAAGGALRDLQRVGQALRLTTAVGLGQTTGLDDGDRGEFGASVRVALALLVLKQLNPQCYRQFLDGKLSAHEVMLHLRGLLPVDDRHMPFAVRAITAYFDVLGDALGATEVTEHQYQELAKSYGFQKSGGNYQSYCQFRDSVKMHFWANTSQRVLAAVEMAHDWPNRYLRT